MCKDEREWEIIKYIPLPTSHLPWGYGVRLPMSAFIQLSEKTGNIFIILLCHSTKVPSGIRIIMRVHKVVKPPNVFLIVNK